MPPLDQWDGQSVHHITKYCGRRASRSRARNSAPRQNTETECVNPVDFRIQQCRLHSNTHAWQRPPNTTHENAKVREWLCLHTAARRTVDKGQGTRGTQHEPHTPHTDRTREPRRTRKAVKLKSSGGHKPQATSHTPAPHARRDTAFFAFPHFRGFARDAIYRKKRNLESCSRQSALTLHL